MPAAPPAPPPVAATGLWLMKSEPETYGWADLVAEGHGRWDGVRNHLAARHLKAMAAGDRAFFYHSVTGKAVVGIMRVVAPAYPDPTAPAGSPWVAVDVEAETLLPAPVPLAQIKATPTLADMMLLRQSRLSVAVVRPEEWALICALGGLAAPS